MNHGGCANLDNGDTCGLLDHGNVDAYVAPSSGLQNHGCADDVRRANACVDAPSFHECASVRDVLLNEATLARFSHRVS